MIYLKDNMLKVDCYNYKLFLRCLKSKIELKFELMKVVLTLTQQFTSPNVQKETGISSTNLCKIRA